MVSLIRGMTGVGTTGVRMTIAEGREDDRMTGMMMKAGAAQRNGGYRLQNRTISGTNMT